MSRPRVKYMGRSGVARLMMSECCYLWCNICGGVLDTDNEGGRRSDMRFLELNRNNDYGEKWNDEDGVEALDDRSTWGEAFYSIVLSEAETEWLLHFRILGLDEEGTNEELWRSSEATNDSSTPGIFLSQEAKVEESDRGEIFYVPSPLGDQVGVLELEEYWRCRGWTRLYQETSMLEVNAALVHSHCLELFRRFSRSYSPCADHQNPTTESELLRALFLRRVYYEDSCRLCNPPSRRPSRMVCWEHCFFGAQVAGWGKEAWRSYAGDELYCADPIVVPRLHDFASSCIGKLPDRHYTISSSTGSDVPCGGPFDLPPELFEHICSFLALRDVCALRSTHRDAHNRLEDLPKFWRLRSIDMHGDWFWELRNPSIFPPRTTTWMQLLWQIEMARTEILREAGFRAGGHSFEYLRDHKEYENLIYRPMLFDSRERPKLPLGLKNRLRIWCCLQSIGKNGTQISLLGQKTGVDLPDVAWDGTSNYADCPTCGRSRAISFNRSRIIAGGAALP